MITRIIYALLLLLLFTPIANAANYTIDYTKSAIAFKGSHAGEDFGGMFQKWNGEIAFDPHALGTSRVHITFDMNSAETGNKMYNGTLPKADWFNTEKFPSAAFTVTKIAKGTKPNHYEATGTLTIKGISQIVTFPFTLTKQDDGTYAMQSTFTIDRLAFDIGKQSDSSGEWVSKAIEMHLYIAASKAK